MKNFFKILLATIIGTFITLALCFFMFFGLIGALMSVGKETTPIIPKNAVLKINLSAPIVDFKDDNTILQDFLTLDNNLKNDSQCLLDAVNAIKIAAIDPKIEYIFINANDLNPNTSIANLDELRDALEEFRQSGKAVISYANGYSQGAYYLASVSDKIYVNKMGDSEMLGVSVNLLFFKNLLDKLGIETQLIRHGKFKAAAEQLTQADISAENFAQNQRMVTSLWDNWITKISKSREIPVERLNYLVDNLKLFSANSMIGNNLIDEAVTGEQLSNKLAQLLWGDSSKTVKYITLSDYSKANKAQKFNLEKNKIAVLYGVGEITTNKKNTLSASKMIEQIEKIRKDSSIKAVVFRVNSPGGDALAAELINNELQTLRKVKPVIISMGEYAASGGYWISANSERIFADNSTITGSIGVFSLIPNFEKATKDKLKINNISINSNKHSDMFSLLRPFDNVETKFMQELVDTVYNQFTNLVASGRNLPVSYVDSVAEGRVWTGADAYNLKLVDEIGGLSKAIEYAASIAGVSNYRTEEFPKPKTAAEQLFEMLSLTNTTVKAVNNPIETFKGIYLNQMKDESIKTYARMPFIYEFSY